MLLDNQSYDEVLTKAPREKWAHSIGTTSPHDFLNDREWTDIQTRYDARRWLDQHWDVLKASEDWHYFDSRTPAMYAEWEGDFESRPSGRGGFCLQSRCGPLDP